MPIGIDIISENGNIKFERTDISQQRPFKGKSLLMFPDNYVVLDLETTGLMPGCDEIIEISALKCKSGKITDEFSTLVCPDDIWKVGSFVTRLTGITQDMLTGQPNICNVLPHLINFIGDEVIVAHNANFDINFIYDSCEEILNCNFSNNFVDTLRISRRILPELENHRLSTIAQYFNIDTVGAHRSLKDCKIVQTCYEELKSLYNDNPDIFIKLVDKLDLRKISATSTEINPDNPFYGKECVFTGKLERMVRANAAQLVVNLGATAGNNVTVKTNYLILGNNDYCSTIKDGKSSKQKKAEKLILSGADLQIIPEDIFYEMIAEYQKNTQD